jgi:hypothetical protein
MCLFASFFYLDHYGTGMFLYKQRNLKIKNENDNKGILQVFLLRQLTLNNGYKC